MRFIARDDFSPMMMMSACIDAFIYADI